MSRYQKLSQLFKIAQTP